MFESKYPAATSTAVRIETAADRHRDRMALRSRTALAAVSEVGKIASIADPARRERCRLNLHDFLRTYFPHSTGQSPFSDEHIRAIDRLQRSALAGGLFSNAFPRGFGKSTISENYALWCILYGHRRFVAIFGSSGTAASGMIDSIKLELSENDLLAADFPEVVQAVRALEGKPQRCGSQHHGGKLTHIEWTADKIVLPIVQGSIGGGAVVIARGIDAATRGLKHKTPAGKQQRPDLAIIDDPQTDESARSEVQTTKRLNVIRKNILKLGGHDRKISVVMNATVIERGDLVEQMADPKKFPAWQSERIQMVKHWNTDLRVDAEGKDVGSVHDVLWLDQYRSIRNAFDQLLPGDQQRAHREATEFYKARRDEMDAGCVVTWEHCFDRDSEISAVQHAYNLLIDDGPEVFASECQNEPLATDEQADGLTIEQILAPARFTGLPMGQNARVPLQYTRMVAHVDVQGSILFWRVVAFDDEFGAVTVDYGTWPKVERAYFTLGDIRKSLRAATGADNDSAAIIIAVKSCVAELKARQWPRDGGGELTLERVGVDANWGPFSDEVYQACRESEHREILVPTHGKFFGAKSERRIEDSKPVPGDRTGTGWRLTRNVAKAKRGLPYLLIDTNRWKTMVEKRLMATPGSPGSHRLNGRLSPDGRVPERLRMLAEHDTSERCIMVEALGRTAPEWSIKRQGRDNHWWDNLVCCYVLANMIGVREPTAVPVRIRKRVKLSEIQEKRGG